MSDTDWERVESGHYTADLGGRTAVVTKGPNGWDWVVYDSAGLQHGSGNVDTLTAAKAAAEDTPEQEVPEPADDPSPPSPPPHTGYAEGAINLASDSGPPRPPLPLNPQQQMPLPVDARARNSR